MIEVGKRGIDPIFESLNAVVLDWLDNGLIVTDGDTIENHIATGDGKVVIVLQQFGDISTVGSKS